MNTLSLLELILDGEERRPQPLETGNQLLLEIEWLPEASSSTDRIELVFFTETKEWYTLFFLDDLGQFLERREKKSKKGFNRFSIDAKDIPGEATQVQVIHPDGIQAAPIPGRSKYPISLF